MSDQTMFAQYTRKMLSKLPFWFKMKKAPSKSNGAKFLETVGLEFEQVQFILDYAYKQIYIQSADVDYVDIVYKVTVPQTIKSSDRLRVFSKDIDLKLLPTTKDFLVADNKNLSFPEIYCEDPSYIDFNNKILYVKKPYDESYNYQYGRISLEINGEIYELKLTLHNVWNFFDEFGMLLGCPRMSGERNREYKVRLLDVFRNVANSSKTGLANGIARELGLRKEVVWEDGSLDIVLQEPMIIANEIYVDGIKVPKAHVYATEGSQILLKGNELYVGVKRTVSYIAGLEMHTLHNRSDIALNKQLFNVDNTATNLLQYYAESIKSQVPIMWNQWKWNEGYWDVADKEASGCAVLPSIYDADISGLMWYDPTKVQDIYNFRPPTLTDLYVDPHNTHLYLDKDIQSDVIYDKEVIALQPIPDKITIKEGDLLGLTFDGENE